MKSHSRLLCALLMSALLLAACGKATPVSQTSPPTILINSPTNGQQVQLGAEVAVLSTSVHAQGIARVELWADGALIQTTGNPSPAPNAPYAVQQIWTATTAGSHSLMVIAYDAAGVGSSPALVSITVVGGQGAPPPSPTTESLPPSPEPIPPATDASQPDPTATATWTPIAVSPQASPTWSATPSPTSSATSTPTPSPSPTASPSPTHTATSKPTSGGGTRPGAPGPITGFESFGTWRRGDQPNGTFTQSSEQVHEGSRAGKLAYNFPSGGNDFVVFLQTHKLGGQPNQISAWVYGDGSKHYLNVWIKDARGETWQFPLGQVKHTGWQQMSAWLDVSAAWPAGHIDGPSNGAVDYPIDFRALVLDDIPDTYRGSGAIYVDDLRCDEASPPTSTPTPSPTATTKPQPPPPPPGPPSVNFWADDYTIHQGDCTFLFWEVENVREVYLDGRGVVGHGEREVCPTVTTIYELEVHYLDGAVTVDLIMIEVISP